MKRLKPKAPSRVAQKSHYRAEYRAIFETLRGTRLEAGLTQIDLAERLGRSQNFVSQAELGYKRLDGLQLWDWMHECNSDMEKFGRAVETGVRAAQKAITDVTSHVRQPTIARKKSIIRKKDNHSSAKKVVKKSSRKTK